MKSAKQQTNIKPQQQSPQSSQKEGSVSGQSHRQQTTPQSAGRTRGQKKIIENGPGLISPINSLDAVLTTTVHGEGLISQPPMTSPVASSGQLLGPPPTLSASNSSATKQRASRALKLQTIPEESTKNNSSAGQSTTGINQESTGKDRSQVPLMTSLEAANANITAPNYIGQSTKLEQQLEGEGESLGEKETKKVVKAKQTIIKEESKEDGASASSDVAALANLESEEDEDDAMRNLLELGDEDEDGILVNIDDENPGSVLAEDLGTQKGVAVIVGGAGGSDKPTITDKEFYKAMQKVKDRGTNAVPPKKSASAYILFGKEKRAEILKRNPMAKVTEVVKEIAQSWKILTKEDRQKYKEAAKRDKERYEKELRALESHSDMLKKPKKCLSAYMIFVKETRPLIVDAHPEMGALQVMQQVGKQWQQMTEQARSEFKSKADKDKVRYLDEQRAFYDEVEKIGRAFGTVITKEGKVVVASTISQNPAPADTTGGKKGSKAASKLLSAEAQANGGSVAQDGTETIKNGSNLLISKRKVPESSSELLIDGGGGTPTKRFKLEDQQQTLLNQGAQLPNKIEQQQTTMFPGQGQLPISISIPAGTQGMQPQWQNQYPMGQNPILQNQEGIQQANMASQDAHLKPKKPLSAYIYFSQEFRDIIRQRFSFLALNQVMRAITYRWKLLTKEQKQPFEQIAIEDKQRYDRDLNLYKKGSFPGRSPTPQIKVSSGENSEQVSQAFFINDDLIQFIQQNCQQPSQTGSNVKKEGNSSAHEDLPTDLNEDDLEALKEAENIEGMKNNESHLSIQTINHHTTGGPMSDMGMMMGTVAPMMQDPQNSISFIPQQVLHQQQDHLIGANQGLIGSALDPAMMHLHGAAQNYNQHLLHPNGGYAYNYYGQPMFMPPNMQHNQQMMPPPASFIEQMNKYQMPHNQQQMSFYNTIQNSLGAGQSGFGGGFGNGFETSIQSNRNYLQNELQNREYDRKTSMSFGFGSSMFPSSANNFGASPALHASSAHHHQNIISSPNIQMQNPYSNLGGLDDPNIQQANAAMTGYFLPGSNGGAPFQLPPSNHQVQQSHLSWGSGSATQQNSSQAQASNSFMKPSSPFILPPQSTRKISSPQLGPSPSSGFGSNSAPALMHHVSFSNSGLFPQNSTGTMGGNAHQQSNMDQPSNISPFLAPSSNPQLQGTMLYQSPSFGGISGTSMQTAQQASGVAQNPFSKSSVPGIGTPGSLLHPNPSIE